MLLARRALPVAGGGPMFRAQAGPAAAVRSLMTLNNLQPAPGAYKPRRRKGRGQGNGKGKTAGKGHKGWHARTGAGLTPGFQGGQSPLYRRIPKFGFRNKHAREIKAVNLAKIQQFIDEGRIDASAPITMKTLYDAGVVTKVKDGVKLLGKGADKFSARVDIEVAQASTSAIEAVERNGGGLTTVYFNKLGLRALTQPHKFDELPRRALPKPKLMPYYTNFKNRGFLSTEMQLKRAGLGHLLPGNEQGKGAAESAASAE